MAAVASKPADANLVYSSKTTWCISTHGLCSREHAVAEEDRSTVVTAPRQLHSHVHTKQGTGHNRSKHLNVIELTCCSCSVSTLTWALDWSRRLCRSQALRGCCKSTNNSTSSKDAVACAPNAVLGMACPRPLDAHFNMPGVTTHSRPTATTGAAMACQPCSAPWCWRGPPPASRAPASRTRGWRPGCGRMHRTVASVPASAARATCVMPFVAAQWVPLVLRPAAPKDPSKHCIGGDPCGAAC